MQVEVPFPTKKPQQLGRPRGAISFMTQKKRQPSCSLKQALSRYFSPKMTNLQKFKQCVHLLAGNLNFKESY